MEKKITIRDVLPEDVSSIKEIINEIWDFASLIEHEKTLNATIALYFNQVIFDTTFGRVVTENDKILGVIFGTSIYDKANYRHLLEEPTAHAMTLLTSTPREQQGISEYLIKQKKVYENLIENYIDDYSGSLDFIILSKNAQNKGIGKMLWDALKQYLIDQNVDNVYVYTDDDCNFKFYDRLGFKCRNKQFVNYDFDDFEYNVTNFMYDIKLKKNAVLSG